MTLPILRSDDGLAVVDPATGQMLALRGATDHALAHAAEKIAEADRELLDLKRALAAELRDRHGVGTVHAGGYGFGVAESTTWPIGATEQALAALVARGSITDADARRAMPVKPKPDARALKALAGRLALTDPEAARILAAACTVSPPSVRDVRREAVDAQEAAA